MFFEARIKQSSSNDSVLFVMPISAASMRAFEDADSFSGYAQTIEVTVPGGFKFVDRLSHDMLLELRVWGYDSGTNEGYYRAKINRINTIKTTKSETLTVSAHDVNSVFNNPEIIYLQSVFTKSTDDSGTITVTCEPRYCGTGFTVVIGNESYIARSVDISAANKKAVMTLKLELKQ
ncbi:TPA: hypothetical protein NJ322_005030 [Vibrio parahaemolyticus]|nr:hypothetical protein [Vibrio parahaemolyticus]HCG7105674.1 hypothetical protein [Vibrio parahaemolyticus]